MKPIIKEKKKLGRPRNADTLPIPRGAMKQIRAISEEAKIPPAQVFEDVIENGLCTVREMYAGLIAFRNTRKRLHEQKPDERMVQAEQSDEPTGEPVPGTDLNGFSDGLPDEFRTEPPVEDRHSDDSIRSGLPENGEGTEVFDEGVIRD
jgi:hypothetical protein